MTVLHISVLLICFIRSHLEWFGRSPQSCWALAPEIPVILKSSQLGLRGCGGQVTWRSTAECLTWRCVVCKKSNDHVCPNFGWYSVDVNPRPGQSLLTLSHSSTWAVINGDVLSFLSKPSLRLQDLTRASLQVFGRFVENTVLIFIDPLLVH